MLESARWAVGSLAEQNILIAKGIFPIMLARCKKGLVVCLTWRVPGGLWVVWLWPRQTEAAPPSRVQMSGLLLLHPLGVEAHVFSIACSIAYMCL